MLTRIILLLALLAAPALEAAKPAWASTLTSSKFGPHPVIRPLKLTYILSWKGAIQSGKLTFELNKPDKRYPQYHISQIYGGSTGVAHSLFPYKGNFVSFMNKKTLRPVSFVGEETDNREHMKTTNRYKRHSMTSTEVAKAINKKGKNGTTVKTFKWSNQLDAVSSMYFIRSQKLANGDQLRFVLHPFQSPYLTEVTVLGREVHLGRECIKLDIKMRKISSSYVLKPYKKMKKSTLWISDDADRIPVELRSKVFIGDVRMTLKSAKVL